MQQRLSFIFFTLVFLPASQVALGQDVSVEADADSDTAAIKAAIQSYLSAYQAKDVEKLAAHWAPDGVYTSRTSGEQIVGRAAIAAEFEAMFAGEVPQLSVETETIEFISPNVALEKGTATVVRSDDDVSLTTYNVIYVRRDGQWLIDRISEADVTPPSPHSQQLAGLAWLIGDWVDASEGVRVEIECRWTRNQNFISRTYRVVEGDEVQSTGLQLIGWDSKEQEIRSWLFDSEGGFVKGTWLQRGDKWVVNSVASLADGGSGSSTSIFRPTDDGNYSWEKINRVVDGQLLPSLDETLVTRN